MLVRSGCRAVVVDNNAAKQLDELLTGVEAALLILLPDTDDASEWAARWPSHRFITARQLRAAADWRPGPVDPNGIAYLLFTSGSTGQPKGVMVAHRNVTHFVDAMVERYAVTEADRLSQTFDLTFDLSAFDMFVTWEAGACLCVPTAAEKALLAATSPIAA
ncbi:MAG: AMP-binding protein [Steroidobacteraceae bacterium]